MALRTEDIPTAGVPLFHVTDFGRWERIGRLRTIRYCCVTCEDCKGVACVVFRPDFVKATQAAHIYEAGLARYIDRNSHTCAVRVQWQNKSARIYFCYPRVDLIDCLEAGARRKFQAELMDFDRQKMKNVSCSCTFPSSCFRMFPTVATAGKSGKVIAERYGDESRKPRPATVSRKRKRSKPSRRHHRYVRKEPMSDRRRQNGTERNTVRHETRLDTTAEWKLNALKELLQVMERPPLIVTGLSKQD